MAGRLSRNVRYMESRQGGRSGLPPAPIWEAPHSAWPVELPIFLPPTPISGAQETSEMALDENRAGAWKEDKMPLGHGLSTEYILISY